MTLPCPVIVVPGVTATDLRDLYPLPADKIWGTFTRVYERVGLHPEDQRYEATLPAQVRPDQPFEMAYKEMVLDLRHNLSQRADRPVPVYVFGYDWRQPLEITQRQLAAFVSEVINKTCLTRHYVSDGYPAAPRVNLVGHSMGGMVIAGYLSDCVKAGTDPRVNRVATICTPFRGSLNAVQQMITGTGSDREREAARLTPTLYYLLPSFEEGIHLAPDVPGKSLFDPGVWQNSVRDSIREAIRLRGSGAMKADNDSAREILTRLLEAARNHRQSLEALNLEEAGLDPEDWLCIVGVGEDTRTRLTVVRKGDDTRFELNVGEVPPGLATGDGTVPLAGAAPPFAGVEQVRFSAGDFGFLELKDKGLTLVAGLHGIIPNMNKVHTALRDHLR